MVRTFAAILVCAFIMSGHAYAQGGLMQPEARPPAKKEKRHVPRTLEDWFKLLEVALDAKSAKFIEGEIKKLWAISTSDTITLLMARADHAMKIKDAELLMELLSKIIDLNPDNITARALRAKLYFKENETGKALTDLGVVLANEPRHFEALVGIGVIMEQLGRDDLALKALRRAIKINPHLDNVPDLIKRLELKIERDI